MSLPPPKPMPKPAPALKPGVAPTTKPAPVAPAPKAAPLGKPGVKPAPQPPAAKPGAAPAPRAEGMPAPRPPVPPAGSHTARAEPPAAPDPAALRPAAPAGAPKAGPAPVRVPAVSAGGPVKDLKNAKEIHLLIGPPASPPAMRDMYADAERRKAAGDDSLVQHLFGLRKATVSYFIKEPGPAKPMLQRVLEEKLGREVKAIVATVEPVSVSGTLAHSLNINLVKTTFADGSPVGPAFSKEVLRAVKNSVGCIFAATWVHERLF